MIRYLLDTNICIYLIKKHPPEVLANFQKIISTDQCQGIVGCQKLGRSAEALCNGKLSPDVQFDQSVNG